MIKKKKEKKFNVRPKNPRKKEKEKKRRFNIDNQRTHK